MQYYVPQFIEMESKVIGPLTLKQFLIIGSPIGIIVALFFILKIKIVVIFLGIVVIAAGIMIAFFKYQGQDLTAIITYGFSYFLSPKEYIWFKKGEEKLSITEVEKVVEKKKEIVPQKRKEESKLKQISWLIQTNK